MLLESAIILPICKAKYQVCNECQRYGTRLFKQHKNSLLAPHFWLSAGAVCIVASALIGYHQNQVAARSVLERKVSLPSTIVVQDFDPGKHSNILNEVQLLGEAGVSEIVTVNVGSKEAPRWLHAMPIYPVGAISRPFAEQFLAASSKTGRRPLPRARSAELAAEASRIAPLVNEPMGLVLMEASVSVEEAGLLNTLGEGAKGSLILVTGSYSIGASDTYDRVLDVLKSNGLAVMSGVPLVFPFPNGERIVPHGADYGYFRDSLGWIGLAFIALAWVCCLFSSPKKVEHAKFDEVEAVGAFPSVFEPIRTQEDLIREEQEQSEQNASATRRAISRLTHPAE